MTEPIEITFPDEVIQAAIAEDDAVRNGTYEEPPEDGDKSGDGDGAKSEKTKDNAPGKTTEDDDGEKGEKPPVKEDDSLEEGILLEEFERDGKPLLITDKDGNKLELKKAIEDHLNNLNWQKTNTEKNQALSNKEKELTEKAKELSADSIVNALNENDGELMKSLDGWFDPDGSDPAKNPFRNIPGPILGLSKEAQEKADADSQAQLEAIQKQVDEEYAELEKIDPKYKDAKERDDLMALALQPKTLKDAHLLREAEGLAAKVKKLTSELKARNKAYDDLVAEKGPAAAGLGPGEDGKGARKGAADSGEVESWESQMKKAEAAFLGT
jgi:hypothetical protein